MSVDCISREAVLEINESHHGQMPNEVNHQIWKEIKELSSVKPKVDVDALINKIDDDLSWCLIDGLGNRNYLSKRLVRIIKEFFAEVIE